MQFLHAGNELVVLRLDRLGRSTCDVNAAAETMPSLQTKHVTPHSFRHATAVHLVSAGVDVTVIRSWLGHVSLDTTNHYANADLETERKALEPVAMPVATAHSSSWKRDTSLLARLDTL